ncbi:MAG: immunoglobulin domain-containing protein [Verrucomicrobiaceae bacterium]|nr:immunoglobulin domain-containing protein [Verrucomicrobiaceae bacterium]
MKKNRFILRQSLLPLLATLLAPLACVQQSLATLALSGNSYTQTFDNIGTALPSDWSVYTLANATAIGTAAAFTTSATQWNTSSGTFRNSASATGATSTDDATAQSGYTNRALSVRQTGSFGDPGASFNLNFSTIGYTLTGLSVDLQMLSVQARSTVWSIQVGVGATPTSWTTLDTFSDPSVFGSTPYTFNATALTGLDNQAQVWFRVVALSTATGSGSRDTFGIDNFTLTYSPLSAGVFWDANGTTAGAGANPVGTWGTDDFWGDADGLATPTAWTPGGDANFSAGTDAVGPFTVTISGNQSAGSVSFQEGEVTLSGGILTMSDSTPNLNVEAPLATIASTLSGTNGITKVGVGTLVLSGTNDFTGTVGISGGTLQIGSDSALGNAANPITLNGTLSTTASFDLPATRAMSGSGTIATATGTQLNVLGAATLSALTLSDVGVVNLSGTGSSVGTLTLAAAGTLQGTSLTATNINASFVGGTATVSAPLDLGSVTRNVNVTDAASTLTLSASVSLGGGGSNRLIKLGEGTLELNGINTGLNKVAVGAQGAVPTSGGVVKISNKDSLGISQMFFNYGTLQATSPLTGANALPIGASLAGRSGSSIIFAGADIEFAGASNLFSTTSTTGYIEVDVFNHTILSGDLAGTTSATLDGLSVGGTGTLTISGSMTGFLTALTTRDAATVEINTAEIGTAMVAGTTTVLPNISPAAGSRIAIGTVGTALAVTSHTGLNVPGGSVLHFDIGGTNRGTDFDALILVPSNNGSTDIAGELIFAGKLDVDFIGSIVPTSGQSFDLLDWDASITPNFSGIDYSLLPTLPVGLAWNTSAFATTGTLSIVATAVDFTINDQPDSATVDPGASVTFTVGTAGPGPFTYVWKKGTTVIDGEVGPSYTIPSVVEGDEGSYTVEVTNGSGTLVSDPAILVVNDPIIPVTITTPPASQTITVGQTATFTVVVSGTGPFSYSWRKGSIPIPSTDSPTYSIPAAQLSDAGSFDVVVTGPGIANSQTSTAATLTVNPAPPPGPISISGNGTITENFNSMGSTAPVAAYPDGWTGYKYAGTGTLAIGTVVTSATSPAITVSNGGGSSGTIYNFGTNSDADRALGTVASGGFTGAYGVSFTNNSGSTIEGSNIRIGFTAEQWRQNTTVADEVWTFEWKIGGNITDPTGWTGATAFDITEILTAAASAGTVDGNSPGNFTTVALTNLTALTGWSNGETLHLRWRDADDTGSDCGMAIDDFTFEVSGVVPPAPSAYWDANGLTAGAGGATPTGTWGTDLYWSSSASGDLATTAFTPGNEAVFAAGTDATGTYTVTLSATQDVSGVVFEEGNVTLTGAALNFNDASPVVNVASTASTIDSIITGSTGLLKQGSGTLNLRGLNTFTGTINIGSGSIQIAADTALGDSANDLLLTGTLQTSASFDLAATRDIAGGGGFAPAPGTELGLTGSVVMTGFVLADIGTVNFKNTPATVGALSFTAAGALKGEQLSVTDVSATYAGASVVVENALDFGNTNRTVTVTDATSSLTFSAPIALTGGANNRLIKQGEGTLILTGANTGLNKIALGAQAAIPTPGGTVIINNKDALGISQMFFNYGTLQATAPLTGANALAAVGLSIGGRDATPAVLSGQDMEFGGASSIFGATGTSGEIVMNVLNHSTLTGALTGAPGTLVSGFTIGGNGQLTLAGDLTGFSAALRLRDTVVVDLATDFVGSSFAASTVTILPPIQLAANTTLTVGGIGATKLVTAYTGLLTAADSRIMFEIAGTSRGAAVEGYDALALAPANNGTADIAGQIVVAGKIKVTFISGFIPVAGQVFDILDWDSLSGTPDFSAVDFSELPDIDGLGLAWNLNNFTTTGEIGIVSSALQITGPTSLVVIPGAPAVFTVVATGKGPFTYQWRKNGAAITGENGPTLTIASATEGDEGSYSCLVGQPGESLPSSTATLIVSDPLSNAVAVQTPAGPAFIGDNITLSATVDGPGPFTYQWSKNGTPIFGAVEATLDLPSITIADAADYSVVISNGIGSIPSNTVTVDVLAPAPSITTPPLSQMLLVGDALALNITAVGKPTLKYQWKKNNASIARATADSYGVAAVTTANAGAYACLVSNSFGAALSDPLSQIGVADNRPQPGLILASGTTTTLKVLAAGNGLTFEWKKDGGPLPADARFTVTAGGRSLVIKPLTLADAGVYSCVVTNEAGSVVAGTRQVTVFDEKPALVRPITFPLAIVGGSFDYQIPVDPAPGRTPTSFSATGLPPGLIVNTKTGAISGKPTATKAGGYTVKLTAKNAKGSDTQTITLNVTAFPDNVAGIYTGPVPRDPDLNADLGGRIDLTIAPNGKFSGKLTLGAVAYAFKGVLNVDPNELLLPEATVIIKRKGNPTPPDLTVTFSINGSGNRLAKANLTDGTHSLNFSGWRKIWAKTVLPTQFIGYHTFGIGLPDASPLIGDLSIPQGLGYGSFTVSKTGTLAVSGKSPDGETVLMSTFVGPEGEILLYRLLYTTKARGSMIGTLGIDALGNLDPRDNVLSGTIDWKRPAYTTSATRTYEAGFGPLNVNATGGFYAPPVAPTLILGLTAGTDNALLEFQYGGLGATPPDIIVSVGDKNKITRPLVNPTNTSITVSATRGTFSGAYTLTDANPRTTPPVSPAIVKRALRHQGIIFWSGTEWIGAGYSMITQLPSDSPLTTTTTSDILSGLVQFSAVTP